MKFEGTPGPWRYTPDQTGAVWAGKDLLCSTYPNCPEEEIGNIMGEWTRIHEMRANARLIAAAPELLYRLQVVTDTLASLQGEDWETIKSARTAIAKALGQEPTT